MKLIFFFIHLPFVYSELHTFVATYTAIRDPHFLGKEYFAEATLDGQQIGYYDDNEKKLVPKQDWLEVIESKTPGKVNILIKDDVQRIFNSNIDVLIKQFPNGAHTYQGIYGCTWDDNTGVSQAIHYLGYDGEKFITLDEKKSVYIASLWQAKPIVKMLNKDRNQIERLKTYYDSECVYWMREFLFFTEKGFGKTEPKVSLLQKSPYVDVKCHVTGFYSHTTVIMWRKDGEEINAASELVQSGETLPNEDGTFQRKVTLRVSSEKWRKNQYSCVVMHMKKTIMKNLTEIEIKNNNTDSSTRIAVIIACTALAILIAVICGIIWKCKICKKRHDSFCNKYEKTPLS